MLTKRVAAFAPPALSPSVTVPVLKAFAAADAAVIVPAFMIVPPV